MSLTPGAYTKIFVDMDTVMQMLSRLSSDLDGFPDPDAVAITSGPTGRGEVGTFSKSVADAADRARFATLRTREHLLEMDQAIREVVTALAEHDASATADANRLFDVLDDAAADLTVEAARTGDGDHSTTSTNGAFGSVS